MHSIAKKQSDIFVVAFHDFFMCVCFVKNPVRRNEKAVVMDLLAGF